tara:strand:- start:271 stop:1728 length:1458 start_codon:yes stop_codon:yes gene_type:complete
VGLLFKDTDMFNSKCNFLIIFTFIFGCSHPIVEYTNWEEEVKKEILAISIPQFPSKTYKLLDYSSEVSSVSIQKVIDLCSEQGGGMVVVPLGIYNDIGKIELKSNVRLHFEDGTRINFSKDKNDFLPMVLTSWEGNDLYNFSSFIHAESQNNIAITGNVLLNGNGSKNNWWDWKDKSLPVAMRVENHPDIRPKLLKQNRDNISVEQRKYGIDSKLRAYFMTLRNCKNIYIKGLTLMNSPMWNIHPLMSENIIIDSVTIISPNNSPNTDGINPESSKNILIQNSVISVGDDCIAIKSGRNNDGRKRNKPSENIYIRNCIFANGHGGIVIGSELSGGVRNIIIENCKMNSPNLLRALRVKSNEYRGAYVKNIVMRDVQIDTIGGPIVGINMDYKSYDTEKTKDKFYTSCDDILVENIQCNFANQGWLINGSSANLIKDIKFKNWEIASVRYGIHHKNVKSLKLENVNIESEGAMLRLTKKDIFQKKS